MTAAPVRLEFADDLFARRHRGLGSPVVNIWVWRLDGPYDAARVRQVGDGLAAGGLSRQLHRSLLPGARDAWTNAGTPAEVVLYDEPLPVADLMEWVNARHVEPLDPHEGRTWRLSAVNLDDGTSAVALCLAHAVGDGGAVIDSVLRAATGSEPLRLPPVPRGLVDRTLSDARDAVGQVASIARWTTSRIQAKRAGVAAAAVPASAAHPPVAEEVAPLDLPEDWRIPRVIVELDKAEVEDVGRRHGGSTNAWFVATVARLMVAIGHVPPADEPVAVSLPVSDFKPGDVRSNSTKVARAEISRSALESQDLAVVRAACKEAYTKLGSAGDGFEPVPLALVQMLPDTVLKFLPKPQSASCMASNTLSLPEPYAHAFGEDLRSIGGFACYQGTGPAESREIGGGLLAWFNGTGPRATFIVVCPDPDRVPDQETLERVVRDELAAWELTSTSW